jgi:hypothetical protein
MKKIVTIFVVVVACFQATTIFSSSGQSIFRIGPSGGASDKRIFLELPELGKYFIEDGVLVRFSKGIFNHTHLLTDELILLGSLILQHQQENVKLAKKFLNKISAKLKQKRSYTTPSAKRSSLQNKKVSKIEAFFAEVGRSCFSSQQIISPDQSLNQGVVQPVPPPSPHSDPSLVVPLIHNSGSCELVSTEQSSQQSDKAEVIIKTQLSAVSIAVTGGIGLASVLALDAMVRKERSLLVRGVLRGKAWARTVWLWVTGKNNTTQPAVTQAEVQRLAKKLAEEYTPN